MSLINTHLKTNNMKKFLFILASILITFAFTSCSQKTTFTGSRNYHKMSNIKKQKMSKCKSMKYVIADRKARSKRN